jgi:hypothetical protein
MAMGERITALFDRMLFSRHFAVPAVRQAGTPQVGMAADGG